MRLALLILLLSYLINLFCFGFLFHQKRFFFTLALSSSSFFLSGFPFLFSRFSFPLSIKPERQQHMKINTRSPWCSYTYSLFSLHNHTYRLALGCVCVCVRDGRDFTRKRESKREIRTTNPTRQQVSWWCVSQWCKDSLQPDDDGFFFFSCYVSVLFFLFTAQWCAVPRRERPEWR